MPRYSSKDRVNLGLPIRPFLYTVDQIATLVDLEEQTLRIQHIYFMGRSTGKKRFHQMEARNIAAPAEKPDWRIAEQELIRWLKLKGFKLYEVNYVIH